MLLILIGAFCLLLLLAWACAPRGVPWAHSLTRLKAGARANAEWMAPPEVVRAVRRDYLAAQAWLAECAGDWGLLARELDQFTAGAYQRRQRLVLDRLAQTRGPRLAAALHCEHQIAVRHFSDDGLRCLVVDRQLGRVMVTRPYWTGGPELRQRLPDGTLVLQMAYDLQARRWKIERLVQALPARAEGRVQLTVGADLPAVAGRDN